jgi:hypothetical protein
VANESHLSIACDDIKTAQLPAQALAELRRLQLKFRARDAAVNGILAALIYDLLYPPPAPTAAEDDAAQWLTIGRYLRGDD